MGLFNWLGNIPSRLERSKHAVAATGDSLPTQSDPLTQSASHKRRGNALLAQGKMDEAAASYRQAIAADRQDADAHLNLGFVLSEQGHYEAAEHSLRQALQINPALADA